MPRPPLGLIRPTFIQRRHNVGPTLYKCYTNILCLLGSMWQECHKRGWQRNLLQSA